jgi:hypothetical protein
MTPPQDSPEGKKAISDPAERSLQCAAKSESNLTSAGNCIDLPVAPEVTRRALVFTVVTTWRWWRSAAARSPFSSAAVASA